MDTWESPKVMAGPAGVRKAKLDTKVLTITNENSTTPPSLAIDTFLKYPKFKIKSLVIHVFRVSATICIPQK